MPSSTNSRSSPAIALRGASKRYKLYPSRLHRLQHLLLGRRSHTDHLALTDMNLSIQPGETVGVIGQNGAGKSTLLSLMSGATHPSNGSVEVNGRVTALLELGVGFHGEWTGRQNAEFYLRLAGAPASAMAERIAEVEAFADIGEYFDQPLRTSSSGMTMRVAFAAAVAAQPDIIIVDEALAVGDASFQHKCFQRLAEFKAKGVTIILVTHRLEIVSQLCSRALVLNHGRVEFDGRPGDAVTHYVDLIYSGQSRANSGQAEVQAPAKSQIGAGGARFTEVTISKDGVPGAVFRSGETATITAAITFDQDVADPIFAFAVKTVEDIILYGSDTNILGPPLPSARAGETLVCTVDCPLTLPSGPVFLDLAVSTVLEGEPVILSAMISAAKLDVTGSYQFYGVTDLGARIR